VTTTTPSGVTARELVTDWVHELESGNYAQGYELLAQRNPGSNQLRFCCLGVLCELLVKRGLLDSREVDGTMFYGDRGRIDSLHESASVLPLGVVNLLNDGTLRTAVTTSGAYRDNEDPDALLRYGDVNGRLTDIDHDPNREPEFSLVELNDTFSTPFRRIATVVRAVYLGEDVDLTPPEAK